MSDKTIDKIVSSTSDTWYTNTKPSATQGLIYNEETGANIAVSYDPKHANLIAAAPELLEACKAFVNRQGVMTWHEYELAKAAIRKAEQE